MAKHVKESDSCLNRKWRPNNLSRMSLTGIFFPKRLENRKNEVYRQNNADSSTKPFSLEYFFLSCLKPSLFLEDQATSEDKSENSSSPCHGDLVDSALPASDLKQQRIIELQRLKANCKPEDLHKLKTKCEILVRDCIAGLLIQLSLSDFEKLEGKTMITPNIT